MDHLVDGVNDTYLAARLLNSTHNYVYAEYYPDTTQVVNTTFIMRIHNLSMIYAVTIWRAC